MKKRLHVLIVVAMCCGLGVTAYAKKKNVLFIAVDDMKPLVNSYGYDEAVTPNMDALAKAGTLFSNAHCQQALCGPSRVSLLSGYFPDTIGVYGMGGGRYKFRKMYPDMVTLPQHFRDVAFDDDSLVLILMPI